MSLVTRQFNFVQDVLLLIAFAIKLGFVVTFGEALRTPEQQKIYVESGRSKTMASDHLIRCAIDLNFFINGELIYDQEKLQPIGDYWESLRPGNRWGGNWKSFKDRPHFENHVS